MAIDWQAARKAWNRDNDTNYETRKEFLSALYDKFGRSVSRVGKEIHVSHPSITRAMKEDGTEYLPKGWRLPTPKQKIMLDLDTENMTRKEIATATRIGTGYCYVLLKRFKKRWKKEG